MFHFQLSHAATSAGLLAVLRVDATQGPSSIYQSRGCKKDYFSPVRGGRWCEGRQVM